MVRLIRPYWSALFKGMVLAVALGVLGLLPPYLGKLLIDEVYPSHNVTLLHLLVLGMLMVSVASAVMSGIRFQFSAYTAARLGNATSLLFFNHLLHLRVRFFDEHRVGEISSRFSDVRNVLNTIARVFETVFVNGAYLLLVPPFMFLLQWKLAVISLVTIPVTVAITAASGRVLRRYWKRTAEAYAELGAMQVEVLSNIRSLKTLAMEPEVYGKASRAVQGALAVQLKAGGYSQVFNTLNAVVSALGTAVFTWYAWTLILADQMTIGDYFAFTAYVGYLLGPLMQITGLFNEFQQSAVNLGRMFEYLDQPVEQDPTLAYEPPPPIATVIEGDVEMRGVGFGYAAGREVLHDVNVRFPRGRITSIVGPSGAGKSSLLRLVLRLEEPDHGEVRMDGRPISEISLPDLRRQVSVLWQEVGLMRGTLWENLTLGADDPSELRVDDAVRLCRLDELVAGLPQGYETPVGEFGATLSGGQRQRLALARAIIRDAPVLLLDEATSNVDMSTEGEILRDLFARMQGKTVIFVTHRVPTAAMADQVVVVAEGRVVAAGTHAELMQESEVYRQLQGGGVENAPRLRAVPQTT
ncbi:MAG TPA: ABC transporter ATP-binding protein [Longimicrobium sp.]|jgi:ABC-type bacteriocin/lantibiotic exporter with double-glycine peptidase domain|nr:ABC transporter ATP-binding protein [Longimicrobium sp.]